MDRVGPDKLQVRRQITAAAARARAGPLGPALLLLAVLSAAGCALVGGPEWRRAQADRIAAEAGFVKAYLPAGRFTLTSYRRYAQEPAGAELVVYIEGDGRAWTSRGRVSADPTPARPVALELAARDPAPSVIYLARPCQYTTPETNRNCRPTYWAHRRFAPEVVDAVEEALSRAKRESGAERIHLVGYSGGGVVAALAAARRRDVASLVTVAAPLDLEAWTAHHGLTPLAGSLDPARDAEGLERVPQRHLVGADDDVVPPRIVESFARRRLSAAPRPIEAIEGYGHRCCWRDGWGRRIAALRAALAGR